MAMHFGKLWYLYEIIIVYDTQRITTPDSETDGLERFKRAPNISFYNLYYDILLSNYFYTSLMNNIIALNIICIWFILSSIFIENLN